MSLVLPFWMKTSLKRVQRCRDYLIDQGADTNATVDGATPSRMAFKMLVTFTKDPFERDFLNGSRYVSFDGARTNDKAAWQVTKYHPLHALESCVSG